MNFEDEYEVEQGQDLDKSLEEFEEANNGQTVGKNEQRLQPEVDLSQSTIMEQTLPTGDTEYIYPGNFKNADQEIRISDRRTKGQPPERFTNQAWLTTDYEEPKNQLRHSADLTSMSG